MAALPYREPGDQADDEFPLILVTGRRLQHYNAGTMTRRTANLELFDRDFLEIHPDDAARLWVTDGMRVSVRSRVGRIETEARVTETDRARPRLHRVPLSRGAHQPPDRLLRRRQHQLPRVQGGGGRCAADGRAAGVHPAARRTRAQRSDEPAGEQTLDELLEALAARTPAPACGCASAWTGALASALAQMTGRFAQDLDAVGRAAACVPSCCCGRRRPARLRPGARGDQAAARRSGSGAATARCARRRGGASAPRGGGSGGGRAACARRSRACCGRRSGRTRSPARCSPRPLSACAGGWCSPTSPVRMRSPSSRAWPPRARRARAAVQHALALSGEWLRRPPTVAPGPQHCAMGNKVLLRAQPPAVSMRTVLPRAYHTPRRRDSVKSSLEIAQEAQMIPIDQLAEGVGLLRTRSSRTAATRRRSTSR